jgi:hypothetical protein
MKTNREEFGSLKANVELCSLKTNGKFHVTCSKLSYIVQVKIHTYYWLKLLNVIMANVILLRQF